MKMLKFKTTPLSVSEVKLHIFYDFYWIIISEIKHLETDILIMHDEAKDSDQVKREAEELAEINRLQEQLRQNMEDEFGVSSKVPSHCTPKKQVSSRTGFL